MGLETVYQKPNTRQGSPTHPIYPYLCIDHCDQVWSTDITYIRLASGFAYLMAVMDWYSHYVLGWSISTPLEADFCIDTIERLLVKNQCRIFNTDQGVQFTPPDTQPPLDQGIQVRMDGRRRALDNIFVERLWRSVKYEYVYLREIPSVQALQEGLGHYFTFYNHERFHQSLDYKTPAQVYLNEPINTQNKESLLPTPAYLNFLTFWS